MAKKLVLAILVVVCLGVAAPPRQRAVRPPDITNNYVTLRAHIADRLAAIAAEEQGDGKRPREVQDDDDVRETLRWDRYWQDHLFVDEQHAGAMADMGRYLHDYFLAGQAGAGGAITPLATGKVCPSGGLGGWKSLGPSSYPAPITGRVTSVYIDGANPSTAYAGSGAGGLFKTVSNGAAWTSLTDGSGYPSLGITSIAVHPLDPKTIYAGTRTGAPGGSIYGFGILKTTDGGKTWQEIFELSKFNQSTNFAVADGSYVAKLMIHPQDSATIYALAANGAYRTTDGGQTWTQVMTIPIPSSNPDGCGYGTVDIDIIPGTTGVSDSRVVVSTLRTAWQGVANSPCGTAKAFLSTAGGAAGTFKEITRNVVGSVLTNRIAAAVQPGNSAEIVFAFPDMSVGDLVIEKYNLASGKTTQLQRVISTGNPYTDLGAGFWKLEIEFSKLRSSTLYLAGNTAYRADLATGTSALISEYWATSPSTCLPNSNTHADVRAMQVTTSGSRDLVVLGTDGGVHKALLDPAIVYTYATANWKDLTGPGLAINEFYDINGYEAQPDVLVGGTQDNGTFEYSKGQWQQRYNYDGWQGTINQSTGQYYGMSNGSPMRGPTGTSGAFPNASFIQLSNGPIVSDPNHPDVIYYGSGQTLMRSNDFGSTWTTLCFPSGASDIRVIRVSPSDSNVIYAARYGQTYDPNDFSGRVYRSNDGGDSWIDIGAYLSPLAWAGVGDIAVDPENPKHVFVAFGGYWPVGNTLAGYNRVWTSTNGGLTWSDLTYDLPAFPISTLAYQRGSDDVLYAGTDVGVFRFNKGLRSWECFNGGLPTVPVTRLELNYCHNKIRAATGGRGVWEANLPPLPPQTVAASATWSDIRYLGNDLTIQSGATLTLKGTLNMSGGTTIHVEQGATLVIDGGMITNCCGEMWEGIQVWGTSTAPQSAAGAQGKVALRNKARIENARVGILAGHPIGSNGYFANDFGGIVQAVDATFANNAVSVEILSYHSLNGTKETRNAGTFFNTTFETTRALNDPLLVPQAHLSMTDVTGVVIHGCTFRNTAPASAFGPSQRGSGVDSVEAEYEIDDLYSNVAIQPPVVQASSVFSGLTYGVRASFFSAQSNKSVSVYSSDFDDVQRGVHITSSKRSFVNGNTFTRVPDAPTTQFADATWAVRIDKSGDFTVGFNTIAGASTNGKNNYGIIVDSGGSAANAVEHNTLRSLDTGILAVGANGSGANGGLQLRCNVFMPAMKTQFAVQTGGTLADQGTSCALGGGVENTFFTGGTQISAPSTAFQYFAAGTLPTAVVGPVTLTFCSAGGLGCATGSIPFGDRGPR